MPALIPGKRRRDETIDAYLNRLSSGAARGGPFVTRELARALVDTNQRLEALTARLQALEDR